MGLRVLGFRVKVHFYPLLVMICNGVMMPTVDYDMQLKDKDFHDPRYTIVSLVPRGLEQRIMSLHLERRVLGTTVFVFAVQTGWESFAYLWS